MSKMTSCCIGAALFLCSSFITHAEELQPEVVVTAERYPLQKKRISSSVTVLDAAAIEASGATTVAQVLRTVPGIDVVQSGGPGGNTAVFLRGANAEHTVVYIDGIEANDPIAATRTFDFANFGVDNVDRIEIVRGPQSVLYGSDAIGGVILITTKKGCGAPSGLLSASGGSYGTFESHAAVSGGDEIISYSLSLAQRNTDGFSAASKSAGNSEADSYENTAVSGLLMVVPSSFFDVSLILRYTNARSELDSSGGAYGDDPNRVLYDNNLVTRIEVGTHLLDKKLNQKIGFSFTDQWMDDNNGVDIDHPFDAVKSAYIGKMAKFDLQNLVTILPELSGIIGYENKTEMGSSSYVSESSFGPYVDILDDRSVTSNGYYGQATFEAFTWQGGSVAATAGARVESHSRFDTKTTWKAGPVLTFGDTRVNGTVGTGFKAPSLFQLYSSYGNELLLPEESTGWDVGIEQGIWGKELIVGATYFHNDFDNLISFNPNTFVSENINRARSEGVEIYGTYGIARKLNARASYTYTDTEDKNTGLALLRRPKHKGVLSLSYNPLEVLTLGMEVQLRGSAKDNDFATYPATYSDLSGYGTVGFSAQYRVNRSWEIFARAENVADKVYEEVLGYGTQGRSFFGGVKYYFE